MIFGLGHSTFTIEDFSEACLAAGINNWRSNNHKSAGEIG